MKPLILTDSLTLDFTKNGFADLALDLAFFDFVWGPQPSSDELTAHLGPRTASQDEPSHWSDWAFTGNRVKTGSTLMRAWPNSASNTKSSNCGSTCGRKRS